MTQAAPARELEIALPSDQDASGRTLGDEELALLGKVIESGNLNSTKGTAVSAVERRFAELFGCDQAVALVEVIQGACDSLATGQWVAINLASSGCPAALRDVVTGPA